MSHRKPTQVHPAAPQILCHVGPESQTKEVERGDVPQRRSMHCSKPTPSCWPQEQQLALAQLKPNAMSAMSCRPPALRIVRRAIMQRWLQDGRHAVESASLGVQNAFSHTRSDQLQVGSETSSNIQRTQPEA